jgi:TPR repeat protein
MTKLIYIISAVLLLAFSSGANAGDCYKDLDFNDCKVRAEQGGAPAQTILGALYEEGTGVLQDYKKAVHWYSKAAEQGVGEAQFNLGWMYHTGDGVLQDYKKTLEWYSKAAEQGFVVAQNKLGVMYADGKGILQDYAMAHMFWNIAAVNGHKDAAKNRGKITRMMTAQQIEKAQRLAREWMQKHQ